MMGNLNFKPRGVTLSNKQRREIEHLVKKTQDAEFYAKVSQNLFLDAIFSYGRLYTWHCYSIQVKETQPNHQHNKLDFIYNYWWDVINCKSLDLHNHLIDMKIEWESI